jgi:hypothetical protein
MISRVRDKDNKANIICVQGAFSRGTSNDITGVTFQNYDDDSKQTYNIASITARDAFGSAEVNGIGELLFQTNTTGSNMTEKMRIKHNGQVCIAGTESFSNALLSVYGTTSITSNLNVYGNINFKGMIYQNDIVYPREPLIQTFGKCQTSSKDYTVLLSWINDLSYSNMRCVKQIMTKSYIVPDYKENTSYSLRIYDATNNNVLAEGTFSNDTPTLNTLSLSNVSLTTLSELELQGKVGSVGSNLVLENILLQYV